MYKLKKQDLMYVVGLSILAIIVTFLFMHKSNSIIETGDIVFHLSRMKGLESMLQGPINYTVFKELGSGAFIFYPNLMLIPAVLIYSILGNLILSYELYVAVFSVISVIVSYVCGKIFFKKDRLAMVFSVVYLFANYRLTNIFYRGDMPESIALIWLPILCLGFYKILYEKKSTKAYYMLAVGMSLVIYTHLLSAFMDSMFLLAWFVVYLVQNQNFSKFKQDTIQILKAVVITVGLTSSFWVPMIFETLKGVNTPATILPIWEHSLRLGDVFNSGLNNSISYFGIGLMGLVSLILPLVFRKAMTKLVWKLWFISTFLILIATNIFPWKIFTNTPLSVIQFPWRFMGIATFILSIMFTLVIKNLKVVDNNHFLIVFVGLLLFITLSASINLRIDLAKDPQSVSVNSTNIQTTLKQGTSYAWFDYAPKKSLGVSDELVKRKFFIDGKWKRLKYQSSGNKFNFKTNFHNKKNKVQVPIFYYSGIKAKINQQSVRLNESNNGTVELTVPEGIQHVEIRSTYTMPYYFGFLLTAGSVLLLVFKRMLQSK